MTRRSITAAALAALVITAGCGEPSHAPTATTTPRFGLSVFSGCSFNGIDYSVSEYFTSQNEQGTVLGLVNEMQSAHDAVDTATTRNRGFDILREIETVVLNGTAGDPSTGSVLTNQVTECMLFSAAELPADYPHDYSTELTPSADGAFGVRGGVGDSSGVVLARGADPLSGLGPQSGSTWAESEAGNPAPSRVLFYGAPGLDLYSYDWKAIPANATFTPSLVVGLCDPGSSFMVQESDAGILAYVDAPFLAGPCPALGMNGGWQPLALAKRAVEALLPTPLEAAELNPGGLGGLAKGFSNFGPYDLGTAGSSIGYDLQPHDATAAADCDDVEMENLIGPVRVRATSAGIPVAGVVVSVGRTRNNGKPAELCGTTSQVSDGNGYVTFTDLALTKPGAYRLVISGVVDGRSVTMSAPLSEKFNVRPDHDDQRHGKGH